MQVQVREFPIQIISYKHTFEVYLTHNDIMLWSEETQKCYMYDREEFYNVNNLIYYNNNNHFKLQQ